MPGGGSQSYGVGLVLPEGKLRQGGGCSASQASAVLCSSQHIYGGSGKSPLWTQDPRSPVVFSLPRQDQEGHQGMPGANPGLQQRQRQAV